MPQFIRIRNWSRFQHYKDRNPPWIKLHRELMTSETWVSLDDASRVLAVSCMMLAAATGNEIPFDSDYLRRVAYLNSDPDIRPLVKTGFVEIVDEKGVVASRLLAKRTKCLTRAEQSREEFKDTVGQTPPDVSVNGKESIRLKAIEILNFLNDKSGRDYKPVPANLKLIGARLTEGASLDDCRSVIAKKFREWSSDPKMREYLRPATLFNATKFAQYQGELLRDSDALS